MNNSIGLKIYYKTINFYSNKNELSKLLNIDRASCVVSCYSINNFRMLAKKVFKDLFIDRFINHVSN